MKIKLTKKQIKDVVIITPLVGVLVWVVFFMNEDSSSNTSKQTTTRTVKKQTNLGKKNTNIMNNFANTPKRFSNAPNYEEAMMAAKIIKEAIDQKEAEHFIHLKISERNLELKSRIAKLEAEIAESNAKALLANTTILSAKNEGSVSSTTFANTNSGQNFSQNQVSYDENGNIKTGSVNRIRIMGWSDINNISVSLNDEVHAANLRKNQVIFGRYSVKRIDGELSCLSLYDERLKKNIPNVCYN